MLAMRPNCECCDKDLPPDAADAMICTFECTFCRDCTETRLGGRCPNCGGNLVARPIRPAEKLAKYPAATRAVSAGLFTFEVASIPASCASISPLCRFAAARAGCPGRSANSIASRVKPEPLKRGFADHFDSSENSLVTISSASPASRLAQL